MVSNTDCFFANSSSTCSMETDKMDSYSYVRFASFIIIGTLSPVAVVGNASILAALWRKTFQRKRFHVLLSGLALTDFFTGLIAQPFIVASYVLHVTRPRVLILWPALVNNVSIIGEVSFVYFGAPTLLIITLMSVERWLYMSRRPFVTSRRGRILARASLLVIPTAMVILTAFKATNQIHKNLLSSAVVSVTLSFYLTTCIAYFKVFRTIRQHQQQVHGNHVSQNMGQPAINLAKYRKSVASILYILGLFSFSFLPITVYGVVRVLFGEVQELLVAFDIFLVFLFLSSSLNPGLYVWRMRDVRAAVRLLFC